MLNDFEEEAAREGLAIAREIDNDKEENVITFSFDDSSENLPDWVRAVKNV